MSQGESKIENKQKESNFFENAANLIVFLLFVGALLWNWDGFWQTKIGPLVNFQASKFPVKYQNELNKLTNVSANKGEIARLSSQIDELRSKILNMEEEYAKAIQYKEDLKMSFWIIEALKRNVSQENIKVIEMNCFNERCRSMIHDGRTTFLNYYY